MVSRDYIMEKIKLLPDESLKEVADFLKLLEARKKKELRPVPESMKEEKADPLSKVIGICEGPSDLAERHDRYIYGVK